MSGMLKINASDELTAMYQKLQLNKKKKKKDEEKSEEKPVLMVCKCQGNEIVVQKGFTATECMAYSKTNELASSTKEDAEPHDHLYDSMKHFLLKNEDVGGDSRFVIADYKGKVFFMLWQPETAKIKSKMTYSSVKDKFKSGLQGVSFQIQATDDGEMAKEVFDNFIAKSAV